MNIYELTSSFEEEGKGKAIGIFYDLLKVKSHSKLFPLQLCLFATQVAFYLFLSRQRQMLSLFVYEESFPLQRTEHFTPLRARYAEERT